MTTSPLLTGGAGFDFEDSVAAVYLTALLLESGVLGLGQFTASRVALQRASSGAPLDDVIVTGMSANGEAATLHLQVKSTLHIGDGPSNTDFRDVLTKAWSTVQSMSFKPGRDRVGAAVGTMSQTRLRALRRLQILRVLCPSQKRALPSSHLRPETCRLDNQVWCTDRSLRVATCGG